MQADDPKSLETFSMEALVREVLERHLDVGGAHAEDVERSRRAYDLEKAPEVSP